MFKSKIKIKFLSGDQSVIENYPPVPASKCIPEWYKDIPPFVDITPGYVNHEGIGSVKKCVPVLDYLTSGYVIRATHQIIVNKKLDETGIESFDSVCIKESHVASQPYHQCPLPTNCLPNKSHFLKINQPWQIKTPHGYSTLIYQPHYFFNRQLEILPAIVDTDKHPEAVALVSILHVDKLIIEPGTPLVVVFPFRRENWKMEVENFDWFSRSLFKTIIPTKWHGMYSKMFHSKKHYR